MKDRNCYAYSAAVMGRLKKHAKYPLPIRCPSLQGLSSTRWKLSAPSDRKKKKMQLSCIKKDPMGKSTDTFTYTSLNEKNHLCAGKLTLLHFYTSVFVSPCLMRSIKKSTQASSCPLGLVPRTVVCYRVLGSCETAGLFICSV